MAVRVRIPGGRTKVTCPSCWKVVEPADLLWVSTHADLRGDAYLDTDTPKRFLPSRFDVHGFALDAKGERCHELACPKCHLLVPRILTEVKPITVSIFGAPSSGKSYLLAASIWELRKKLSAFNVNFTDADPVANRVISDYEQRLFLTDTPRELVRIPKTEPQGDLYQSVNYGDRMETYGRPFVFSLRPSASRPRGAGGKEPRVASRALCLYDNAGEHFLPSADYSITPATDHLALSESLIFVFDPLQDPTFRAALRETSHDPQLGKRDGRLEPQDKILLEAAKRIRQKANLPADAVLEKPLIVAVNKYDTWSSLLPQLQLGSIFPYAKTADGTVALNLSLLETVSQHLRDFLAIHARYFVDACDSFCTDVLYVPVSPQGCSPQSMEDGGSYGVRPGDIQPIWAEVPLLYAIARSKSRLIPAARVAAGGGPANT